MEERQNNERPIEDYQKAKDKIFKLVNTYRTHLYISHQDLFGTEIGGPLYDLFRPARSIGPIGHIGMDESMFVDLGFRPFIDNIAKNLGIPEQEIIKDKWKPTEKILPGKPSVFSAPRQ